MRIWTLLATLVLLLGFALIYFQLHPPKKLTIAAGPHNGAYGQVADRYRKILARDGIDLKVIETAGSVENAQLISAGQVDVAILQGGISPSDPAIEAIGSIFFEPMIFLARSELKISTNPALWRGLRISAGLPGSGTAAAFVDFQVAVGLGVENNRQMSLSYQDAVAALVADKIDVAVFVAPIDAPYLKKAYNLPDIQFLSLAYSDAISRRLEYANTVTVPTGAISLNPVVPAIPHSLLALEARLAIDPDLHPALVNRITMAAKELHGARDLITDPETFPAVEGVEMPVNNAARLLIQEGPSAWHDWLPYWMAAQVNRLLLLLLPVLFILLPLFRALPALYAYFMGWKVWHYYPEIREIEEKLDEDPDAQMLVEMDAKLNELDDRLSRLRVPGAYRQAAYHARIHIDLVRKRIETLQQTQPA
ncbi:hypothetical protein KL867_12015 [Ruegeria litorea]|uniref:TRAP transporter solute receptor, TAXI family n=1 Tax=Falsiruegeria litorea TaxID=1280831 RepID=A0ABS5WRM5_9RHOB|nr:TAXI family TRAP transporter solute-binding subunit [Falsiruegeria litorea]MBT3141784.1 hypothetical protein [Falsiruegeria litorea]